MAKGRGGAAAEAARRKATAARRGAEQREQAKAEADAQRQHLRERALGLAVEYGRQVLVAARRQDAAAIAARQAGASWAEVGRALGISKQSAQARYGDRV